MLVFFVRIPEFKLSEECFIATCVKAPLALLEEVVKIVRFDAVKSSQVTLSLISKILDSIDVVLLVCKQFRMIDTAVVKIRNIQGIVDTERVGVHNAVGLHFLLDDRQQSLSFGIGYDCRVNPAAPL